MLQEEVVVVEEGVDTAEVVAGVQPANITKKHTNGSSKNLFNIC